MENTYTLKGLQRDTAAAIRQAEGGEVVTITRHDEPVAVIVSHQRMAAIVETMELLADAAAIQSINEDRSGAGKTYPLSDLK